MKLIPTLEYLPFLQIEKNSTTADGGVGLIMVAIADEERRMRALATSPTSRTTPSFPTPRSHRLFWISEGR